MKFPFASLFRALIAAFTVWGAMSADVRAQGVTPTKGKDFWLGFMKNYETEFSESLDLFIVSDIATSGTVTVPGQAWSQAFSVAPNVTTTVTIPNNIAEVYSNQVVEGKGVHVETQDTVAVFAISFNPYTADGTKVLPTPTLGTNYMVAAYAGLSPWDSELLIVATEDGTEVEITPSVNTAGGNAAGSTFTVQLDEGQAYQMMAAPGLDLTGTRVKATEASGSCRPFAVFSGAGCTNLPSGCIACDHIYDENFPIELWGSEYYVTPFVFELNPGYSVSEPNYTYRVLASVNGTSVSIDGGAPFNLNAGQFQEFQYTPDPHCVNASQPVAVIQYMEGISCGGNGDPAMLVLDDVGKKIDNITFSTVESTVITNHYLNVVINAADLGNVTFDGNPINPNLFDDFPGCPGQLWCGFEISEGSHTLDAPGGGVTGYVYGNGDAESYAYSVGSFSPIPPIEIDEAVCTDDQVVLEIAGNYYNPYWYNYSAPDDTLAEGFQFVIPPPIENGIYVGVGNEFVSGCEEEFYFSVEVPDPPVISVFPSSETICQYESVQLGVNALPESAVYTYSWSPSSGLDDPSSAAPVATPLVSTVYTVTVSTPTGCGVNTGSVTISVEDGSVTRFEASPEEAFFCVGGNVQMEVEAEARVWSDNFDPGISWGDWTDIQNGSESSVCGTVSGNALYFNGSGQRSATTNPVNCTAGGTIYFSLKIANGVAPCDNAEPGDNVLLEYSLNGVVFNTIQTYFESAYPDFISISEPIPAAALSPATRFRWRQVGAYVNGQDNWVLDDAYVGVVGSGGFDFSWSPAEGLDDPSGSSPVADPVVPTMYYVEMTDPLSGCDYIDSVWVDVGLPFELVITPDTSVCDVQGIELSALPDNGDPDSFTYLWSPLTNITGATTSTPVVSPAVSTTYSVVVESSQGCTQEGEVSITVNELLDLNVTVSDASICAGEEITLEAEVSGDPAEMEFAWTPSGAVDDPQSAVTTASPWSSTTYTSVVTHTPSGCQLTESIDVEVIQAFTIDATPSDTTTCITQGMNITATSSFNGPLTWSWSPANLVNPSNQPVVTMVQNSSAELVVSATNSLGCIARDTVLVSLLVESTDLGPDTGFCEDSSVTLNPGWPDTYTFDWSNNATTPVITVNQSGIYSVVVTSPLGCVSSDEVQVDVFSYPEVDLGPDVSLCEGDTYTVSAGDQVFNYLWSTGETTSEIELTASGYYEVSVDNVYCVTEEGINVVFNPLPVDALADAATFCFGFPPYSLELDAQNPGYLYLWSNGSSAQMTAATEPGYYTVRVTSPFGCERTFGILIDEYCPGSIFIPNSFTPDGDGVNDVWLIEGYNVESFNVKLWNRWGELFFESSDIHRPWLGQRRQGDQYVENGSYVYRVTARFRDEGGKLSDEIEFNGHVIMVR